MADPILDEDMIIAQLKAPVTLECIELLQCGAMQTLIDLYDRKVTRTEFLESAAACITLYSQTNRFRMLHSIKTVFDAGNLNQQSFDKASDDMCTLMRKQCEMVIEIVKRVQECPTSQDKVH